eukprot:gene15314-20639_t
MGENARKDWEWHNTVVGKGYQAKGVVRQRETYNSLDSGVGQVKIVDMRGISLDSNQNKITVTIGNDSKQNPDIELDDEKDKKKKKKYREQDSDDNNEKQKKTKHKKHDLDDYQREHKSKKNKKNKEEKKHKKKKSDKDEKKQNKKESKPEKFNALLQLFASKISNKTLSFTINNN